MPRVLMPLADGVEEMEAVIVVDVLRRAGWTVVTVGLGPGPVTSSRQIRLLPDAVWPAGSAHAFDVLVIPGGAAGVERLASHTGVLEVVREFHAANRWIGAICAGPLVLQAAGILHGRQITCHPAVASRLTAASRRPERVVMDGRIVTSQGPGTAMEFALALVRLIEGPDKAASLAASMVVQASGMQPEP